ncbi:hypothetical protein D3C72_2562550 [compost metagenome]
MLLCQLNAAAAAGGKFMGNRIDSPARRIAQGFDPREVTERLDKRRQHGAVAAQFAVQTQTFTQV